jgi:ribosomal protein S18 acetylase RimI-like enzyme
VDLSTNLALRPAIAADADEIASLVRSAYRDQSETGWTTEAHLLADERIDADEVRAKIARPNAVVLTVRTDTGELIACCEVLRRTGKLAYFGMFAVSPAMQAAGIGRRVLAAAEELARERWGATQMEMTVIGQRDDLIAWYLRRGYVRTAERRPFPYDQLVNGAARRDDLYFTVLTRKIASEAPD